MDQKIKDLLISTMDKRIRVEEENIQATLYKKIEKLEKENKELVAQLHHEKIRIR